MKRGGPLKRRKRLESKTPLRRGAGLKRTRLKRTRPKTSPEREKYRRKFKTCQLCGEPRKHVHEIVTRAKNASAIEQRCCFLSLCERCHDRMHDHSDYPLARQYALKQRVDPEGYCRETLNRMRGRAANAITQEQVDEWNHLDRVRLVPIRPDVRAVGRESNWPGRRLAVGEVDREVTRNMAGRTKQTAQAMSKADDLRATIRALEIKANVQRGHLQRTENELANCKRQLSAINAKGKA